MKLFAANNGIDHKAFLEDGRATHIVMQITYGVNGVFEFKKEVTEPSQKEDIKGNLNLAISRIPDMSGSSGGSLKMDKKLIEATENVSVSFHGDFIINSPTTFTEAIAVCRELPGKTQMP